jgi:hypothetical protein
MCRGGFEFITLRFDHHQRAKFSDIPFTRQPVFQTGILVPPLDLPWGRGRSSFTADFPTKITVLCRCDRVGVPSGKAGLPRYLYHYPDLVPGGSFAQSVSLPSRGLVLEISAGNPQVKRDSSHMSCTPLMRVHRPSTVKS